MKVSLNTIKQYTSVDLSVEELVAKINQQLGGVEAVTDLGARYKGATIVRVVQCDDHPNADRLHVCKVDDGGVVEGVERDENGLVQVVCGAPNVTADMFAVWLPPTSTVPASYADKEPFVLEARELRGVVSNGMLASAKELAIGDSHEGLLVIHPDEERPTAYEIKPGTSFAQAYGLDDILIDIENKMFTHRPDLFGQLGVAREIAGIQHKAFTSPSWYKDLPQFNSGDGLELSVENSASAVVPRFMAVAIKNVTVAASPLWLQAELIRLGGKPINNIVDVTNYIMLLTAQPTHAYDYDKLRGHKLEARMAVEGETVKLLNDKTYQLTENDIVIADGEGPVGLAGIMGGGDSEVSTDTKNIVLEIGTFDMYAVRKSSMRHGVFTDALTRFNKGQSPRQNSYILDLLQKAIADVASGEQASDVYDLGATADVQAVMVTPSFISERLGVHIPNEEIKALLTNVEFTIEERELTSTESLEVGPGDISQVSESVVVERAMYITPPFWRTDIELPEDIVEEVGRLYGFDRLPRELPVRSTKPAEQNSDIVLKRALREVLSRAGANEVLTYSFVHEKTMKRAGQDAVHAYRLSNALSPDLQYYRLSLMPSLLDKVHPNSRAGYDRFALFEINKVHFKGEMDEAEPSVPNEDSHVALVIAYSDKQKPSGAAYYHAKKYAEQLSITAGVTMMPLSKFDLSKDTWGAQLVAPYEPGRSAVYVRDGQIWGVVGEYKASVRQAFKLPDFSAGFEMNIGMLTIGQSEYKPLPRFPKVSQDISLKVPKDTQYSEVYELVASTVSAAGVASGFALVEPRAIYQPEGSDTKTVTLHIEVASETGTLTDKEVSSVLDAASERAAAELDAERV